MLIREHSLSPLVALLAGFFSSLIPSMAEMSLEQALEVIRNSETVDDEAVGYGGDRTKTYNAFAALEKLATKEQILSFTTNKNSNIKAYASKALRSRFPEEDFFDLLMVKLSDETKVRYFSGCFLQEAMMGDFYFNQLSGNLTTTQRSVVLEYLLAHDNKLATTSSLLENAEIPDSLLPRIRELAHEGNDSALFALAKFKREEDGPVIIAAAQTNPFNSFRCIAMNPLPAYFRALKEAHPALLAEDGWSNTQKEFYKAVATFKDDAALELLSKPLDGNEEAIPMRKYHLEFVFEAISAYQNPLYDELKWRLWSESNQIDLNAYIHLLALDKDRAIKLTRGTLDHLDWNTKDDLLTEMLTQIDTTDPAYVEEVVARELAECDVGRYSYFAEIAGRSKMASYIQALFKGVETADNPHIFLPATKALFAYGNDAIDKRVREAPAKNPELGKGWGGEAFADLLENRSKTSNPDEPPAQE